MTMLIANCLSQGETLDVVIRRNCAIGFDLPDAARRHAAEQAALIDPDRIS